MGKIATAKEVNAIIGQRILYPDNWCPPYSAIKGTMKADISGEYGNNQLVKLEDITHNNKYMWIVQNTSMSGNYYLASVTYDSKLHGRNLSSSEYTINQAYEVNNTSMRYYNGSRYAYVLPDNGSPDSIGIYLKVNSPLGAGDRYAYMSSFTKASYTSGHSHVYDVYGPDIVYRMINTRGGSTTLFNRVLFFDEPLDNNKQFLSDAGGLYEEIVSQTDTVGYGNAWLPVQSRYIVVASKTAVQSGLGDISVAVPYTGNEGGNIYPYYLVKGGNSFYWALASESYRSDYYTGLINPDADYGWGWERDFGFSTEWTFLPGK